MSNISVDDVFIDEISGTAVFTVRLDAPNAGTVTVNYATISETAVGNVDYTHTTGTLTFAPGVVEQTVSVLITNDITPEVLEHFYLDLTSPSANAKLADAFAIGSIVDNEGAQGTPAASLTDAVVNETDHTVTVTVILDKPSTGNVSFTVAAQDATATASSDFRALSVLGKITFAPGELAKTITFGLLKDAASESAEVFDVVLSSPVGATIADARAHVTIVPNGAGTVVTPVVSVANVIAVENKGFIEFVVTLNAPSAGNVSVNYATSAGTASANVDYTHLTGTLNFLPGETSQTVRIGLIDDASVEAMETFSFNLSGVVNATIGNASATATIVDNESPAPVAPIAIAGTSGNDVLKGTQFADALAGGNGNDVLDGGAGNDSYDGGTGNDIYLLEETGDTYTEAPGGGTDLVISYLSTHTLGAEVENLTLAGSAVTGIGNSENNIITGNAGTNTIEGGVGDDILNGGAGTDTLTYSSATAGVTVTLATLLAQNTVGAGTDTIGGFENLTGSAFNDTLTGDATANIIEGKAGDDQLNGGLGTDTATYASATGAVTVNLGLVGAQNTGAAGVDTLVSLENLIGTAFNDTLIGSNGNNVMNGLAGNDTLSGLDGNDIMTGGVGDDVLDGGNRSDTTSYSTVAAGVTVNLGLVGAQNTVGAGTDTLSNFENLTGSNFNDTLTGNAASNVMIGNLGDDVLDGGAGRDTVSYETTTVGVTVNIGLAGPQNTVGAGIDTLVNFEHLRGGNGDDTLTGNAGSNILIGHLGNDVLDGAAGSDTASYQTATAGVTVSLAVAGAQNTVNAGTDTLTNIENLTGSNYNDTLTGNVLSNVLIGGLGNDILNGGVGTDTASYETATAGVTVNLGLAGAQNTVGAGIDTLVNVEALRGSNFNDTFTGNTANNTFTGGFGNDTMTGNSGADSFVFNQALNATTNKDTITDFSPVDDTLVLENAIFTKFTATGAIPAGTFVANAGGVAGDANDFLLYNTTTGTLSYDAEGNGAGRRWRWSRCWAFPHSQQRILRSSRDERGQHGNRSPSSNLVAIRSVGWALSVWQPQIVMTEV